MLEKTIFVVKFTIMTLEISDDIIKKTRLSEKDLRVEFALYLFQKYHLSFGQARRMAGLDVISFQKLLAQNKISLHYDVEDFGLDLKKALK